MADIFILGASTILVLVITHLLIKIIKVKYTFWGFPESIYDKHWLLGHLPHIRHQGYLGQHFLDKIIEWTEKYPTMFLLWIGPATARVVLNHPDSLKQILRTADPKPVRYGQAYRHGIPWLGEGLLIAGGAKWKRSRRLLTPAFHFDILKPYVKVYKTCADQLVKNIQTFADRKESAEVFGLVSGCTLDIILQCAFSYETDCQNILRNDNRYVTTVYEIATEWTRRNTCPWLYSDLFYFNTKMGKQFKSHCDYVHTVADDIIAKRRRALEDADLSERKYLDFLDILLTAKDGDGQGMSIEDIRSEVDTFLFEGHDTTASAISWILYSLAEHPEHQMKCQEEIDRVVSETESGELEWNDLGRLEYLTQCIKEGMRLHSPVPSILRENQAPITIDNHVIPAGSCVAISIYCLHHNPAVWGQNHMDFRPERFTKENIRKMDPFAYCPFSAGPRNCIGQQFAMAEEKIVLSTLLQRFNFSVDKSHQIEIMQAAVMKTKTGIKLFASPR
ncbi:cytochrome P450 4F8 isoform X2 [Magallana gigas]|uniref:cytochrome P450 4F8 isoform X2 n=1 Tax=Magallana gigas TaxID=29159 RepID=UPI003340090B